MLKGIPHGAFRAEGPGIAYRWRNDGREHMGCMFSCFTAKVVTECVIKVDEHIVDGIFAGAGGSHSWWFNAGGGLLRYGLKPGQEIVVEIVEGGPAWFRIDWNGV